MPDHRRGFVRRGEGIQPPDINLANAYRSKRDEPTVIFTPAIQRLLVDTARKTGEHLDATIHAVATEPTHAHVLVSWSHDRDWKSMRASIRSALSRGLNEQVEKRNWFADSPSRKHVRDYEHFDYLMLTYLPKHGGAKWFRDFDVQAAKCRMKKN
jgi:REP element-mobilizing transposase RayT